MGLELVDLLNTAHDQVRHIAPNSGMALIWWSNTCMVPQFYLQNESHFVIITDYVFSKKTASYYKVKYSNLYFLILKFYLNAMHQFLCVKKIFKTNGTPEVAYKVKIVSVFEKINFMPGLISWNFYFQFLSFVQVKKISQYKKCKLYYYYSPQLLYWLV